jgi:hypothetical protein
MAAITQGKRDAIDASQRAVEFTFSLLAIYVIPALVISSVILAMQATGLINDQNGIEAGVLWIGGLVMNISTELASAGSFKLARAMEARGHAKTAGQVKIMGVVLTGLVIVTVCFAKFNVTGTPDDILVIARIAAALIYALVAHSQGEDRVTAEQRNQIQEMFSQFREQQVESMIAQCRDKLKAEMEGMIRLQLKGEMEAFRQQIEAFSLRLQSCENDLQLLSEIEGQIPQIEALQQSVMQSVKRVVTEEVSQVRVSLEQRVNALPGPSVVDSSSNRPVRLLKSPAKRTEAAVSSSPINRRQFVYQCLAEDPEVTISEIQARAEKINLKISAGSISQYRTDFKNGQIEGALNLQIEDDTEGEFEAIEASN